MRIKLSEVTPVRVLQALYRRVSSLPDHLAWRGREGRRNAALLAPYRDKYLGERCFLIANGPSLKKVNLSLLKNEHVICMNRAYLLFDEIGFVPDLFVCVNELVLEQFAKDIQSLNTVKFINWNRRKLFSFLDDKTFFIKPSLGLQDKFSPDLSKSVGSGGTVTFVALQIAFYLGFREVIIVGLDHNFTEKGTPNKTETRTSEVDSSHFHPNYFPKGMKWQLPDLLRSEMSYQLARNFFEAHGGQIIDATDGGKCNVFRKVDYLDFFREVEA